MTNRTIKIATRKSPLAMWQAEFVRDRLLALYPELTIELVTMTTQGDKILDTPLAKVGGKGLFVKELEQGMLAGEADIAVHSMKDVPMVLPDGLHLPVICTREDPRDAFVSNEYATLDDLPAGAKVGTSSLRRECQLRRNRPDLEVLPLRIETRRDDVELNRLLAPLRCARTWIVVSAERAMNRRLAGGCQVPIGGFALIDGDEVWLRGLVGKPDGSEMLFADARAKVEDAEALGEIVAEQLLAQGADRILAEVYGDNTPA